MHHHGPLICVQPKAGRATTRAHAGHCQSRHADQALPSGALLVRWQESFCMQDQMQRRPSFPAYQRAVQVLD
jgi:hypothetical protein